MPEPQATSFDRFFGLEVRGVDADSRTITAYASTGEMDRHGTIIEPTAFKKTMPEFMKNPVVLGAHQPWTESMQPPVVGKVTKWSIDDVGLLVTIQFATTAIAEEWWQQYLGGFMRALSVGFRVVAREMRPREDGSGEFEVFTEVELLEISLVAVGSNREALVTRAVGGAMSELDEFRAETLSFCDPTTARVRRLERQIEVLIGAVADAEATIQRAAKQTDQALESGIAHRLEEIEADIDAILTGLSIPKEDSRATRDREELTEPATDGWLNELGL